MKIYPKIVDTFSLEAIYKCPEVLFNGVNSDKRKKIEFYNENGHFVGGVSIMIEEFDFFFTSMFLTNLQIPLQKYCMYIEAFEVSIKFRHQGYGRLMLDYLEHILVDYIILQYRDEEDDNGISKRFWEHMGYNHSDNDPYHMTKELK